ncbi:phosphotransferase family protein [Nocardioides sp. URHA0020]|uniref:phosphotransferase family protein n=1 Tax=Nocardioides sp. URHA0020 TaxID=1380392 RepID=UPI0004916F39|nr:phosphotransferase [Nocardioides sp. URHA0020]
MEFASLEPLEGGWSGQTFVADAGGERTVVRIYADGRRGPVAQEVDAAVLRLVRGLLPVPEVLEVRRADPATGLPALLVTEFLPGVRGDLLLPTLDDDGLRRVGESVGRVVATLGGMPLLDRGVFVDGDLRVEPVEPELPESLGALRATAEALLDEETRSCLVHGDLDPANLLLDPGTGEVVGVLDWELAHAGHPFADLGSVLRFDRAPAYVDAVLATYAELRGTPPGRALELARAADLHALAGLAPRAGQHPVATRAAGLLAAIGAGGDLHAAAHP